MTLNKDKPNKNEISKFRPVSVLNMFSKIYERVFKDQIPYGKEKYFSPFLSAFRKNYTSQNILLKSGEKLIAKVSAHNFIYLCLTNHRQSVGINKT